MTKNKPTLPPRKWYSLQQAADKLTREFNEPITIDDLLHYYQIDLLPLSVYIKHYPIETCISDLTFSSSPKRENVIPMNTLNFNILSKPKDLIIEKILYIELAKEEKEIDSIISDSQILKIRITPEEKNKTLTIDGFMNIYSNIGFSPFNIESLKKEGILLNNLNYLISPSHGDNVRAIIYFSVSSDKPIYLSINNIYILDNDLNEFIEGKSIGSFTKIIEEQSNISLRKQTNQAEFIKALLKLHYGIDEPEKARTLLGKNGELAKNFARASIEINITPETLRNWLNTAK